jgi:hypothetical protein
MTTDNFDTHKEIVEMKNEIKDLRQTDDARIQHERPQWEAHLDKVINGNEKLARLLLLIDGTKSRTKLEKASGLNQVTCWRWLEKLEAKSVIVRLEQTDRGSPIYKVAKWYKVLRLNEYVESKLSKTLKETTVVNAPNEPEPSQNQNP